MHVECVKAESPHAGVRWKFGKGVISSEETNRYAESFFENTELTPASRALKWKNANKEEMKRFIALLLLQGVVQKPVEKWFWSKRPILSTPFFGKVMDHIGFRMKLIERLIEEGSSDSGSRNFTGSKISENEVRLIGRHFPSYVESDSSHKKKNIAKMCGMQPDKIR
ncbi:piggyBac transposable element-derived protein 4 [Trichonephila clavipes]|nr:piggyBac transposable element-derived protein 4 [Trichonephila clavipes]